MLVALAGSPVIMVVEDEPEIGQLLRLALDDEGYQSYWAASGRAAIRLTENVRPDLVLLDVMLPDLDGVAVAESVRKRCGDVPVIVVSAVGKPQIKQVAEQVHAADLVEKPFDMVGLLDAVRRVLAHPAGAGPS
jgi:two-component system OmpR family response regulator